MNESHSSHKKPVRVLVVDEAIAVGGVERLWLNLLPEMAMLCEHLVWMVPDHRLSYFKQSIPATSPIHFEPFHAPNWKEGGLLPSLFRRVEKWLPKAVVTRCEQYFENRRLQEVARKHRITHVFYPALFVQQFPKISLPVAAAIMDINYHPDWREECLRNLAVWVDRADTVMSISAFTRDEIVRLHPTAEEKVKAIAITSDGPPANGMTCDGRSTAKAKDAPVLYYPASFNPHKGHAVLLQALRTLADEGAAFRLILTGGKTDQIASTNASNVTELEDARLAYTQAPESFRGKIDIRGMVSTETVDECFEMADLVVLPSSYEGFGLPLAEAVARGKRVVCADIPAFREQIEIYGFDKAVTFVSEATPAAWSEAIRAALAAPRLRPYSTEELQALFARRTWSTVAKAYTETLAAA